MSKFSPKSDFADVCLDLYSPNKIASSNIYVKGVPLKIKSPKDLIPYYGYLVSSISSSDDGVTIFLANEPYADTYDRERIRFFVESYINKARKAKRLKKEVQYKDFDNYVTLSDFEKRWMYEIAHKNNDFLLKHWVLYRPGKDNIYYINDAILKNLFYNVSTATSKRYRESLLEYASKWFGKGYCSIGELDIENCVYNNELVKTYIKVLSYYNAWQKYLEEESII